MTNGSHDVEAHPETGDEREAEGLRTSTKDAAHVHVSLRM